MRVERTSDYISCEYMDLIELAHMDRIYPVMYCKLVIQGDFNLKRFKESIEKSAQYIPEILYSVDFRRCRFINLQHTVNDVFFTGNDEEGFISAWDLSTDTQLKIFMIQDNNIWNLTIGMSHVLTDGVGFLQYLYLLASIYNGITLPGGLKNIRNMDVVIKKIPFCISKDHDSIHEKVICRYHGGNKYYCLCCCVNEMDFKRICVKAESLNISINDVLMTAYSRIIAQRLRETNVSIPCTVDLRRVCFEKNRLTIGNMTGLYRSIPVFVADEDSFETTLLQIHKEVKRQRETLQCFRGIKILQMLYRKIPARNLVWLIRGNYRLNPISYTNMGKIDSNRLYFADCNIKSCYTTGTYRKASDFQLSVSTFKNVCTLNCTLSGGIQRKTEGETLLEEIRKELIDWLNR